MIGKVKVCFNCKKYIRIFLNNPISQNVEKIFNIKHAGHMTQVICEDEFTEQYELEKIKKGLKND